MTFLADRVAPFFWDAIPRRLSRAWAGLAVIATDGRYLLGWPSVAALMPPVAFLAGFATGGFRPRADEIFTMSIAWPVVLLAFGALGAGIGLYAWLGFAIGDFLVFPHISWETELGNHLLKESLPLLIMYEVLLGVAVLLPIAASSLPRTIERLAGGVLRKRWARVAGHLVLADLVAAATALSWSASIQVLIRPLATFHGGVLGPTAIQTMRGQGFLFIATAVAVTTVRVAAEAFLDARDRMPAPLDLESGRADTTSLGSRLARMLIVSVLISLGLTGLLDSPYDATQDLILFSAVMGSALLREFIVPAVRPFADAVSHVPVLLRVVAVGVIGGIVGQVIVSATSLSGSLAVSFMPVLVSAAIGILVAGVLIPAAPAAEAPQP